MILTTLLIFSNVDKCKTDSDCTEEYERCAKTIKCENEAVDPKKLTEDQIKKLRVCRIKRYLKCSTPEEDGL